MYRCCSFTWSEKWNIYTGQDHLKDLKELIVNEWRFEMSTVGNNDLQPKKWSKPANLKTTSGITGIKAIYKHVRLVNVKNHKAMTLVKEASCYYVPSDTFIPTGFRTTCHFYGTHNGYP